MIPDKNVEKVIASIELFVQNLAVLLGVFNNYDGGDFCSGMYFGANGAGMLTDLANLIMN